MLPIGCYWGLAMIICGQPLSADPRIIHIPQDRVINEEREAAWVKRCNPRIVRDALGVGRYVYSAPGCEYGD